MADKSLALSPVAPPYEETTLDQIYRLAETLARAGVAPDPAIAAVKALRGAQVGLDPIASQSALYAFRGRDGMQQVGMWTRDMLGLVRSRGIRCVLEADPTDPETKDPTLARWAAWLGEDRVTATYTRADAEKAGLWAKWSKAGGIIPEHMLVWRAASRLIERHLSHVLGGLPTVETLEESAQAAEPITARIERKPRDEVVEQVTQPVRPDVVDVEVSEAPAWDALAGEWEAARASIAQMLVDYPEDEEQVLKGLPESLPDDEGAARKAADKAEKAASFAGLLAEYRGLLFEAREHGMEVEPIDPWGRPAPRQSRSDMLGKAIDKLKPRVRVARAAPSRGGES